MAGFKIPDFNERSATARAAKQSALDRLRNKPELDPAVVAERDARQAAREAAAAEKRAARQRAADERKAARIVVPPPDADDDAGTPPAERVAPSEAESKAARDARYAARKSRKR